MESVELREVRNQNYTMKESLRALRTNIQFCGDDIRAILFTSTMPDEGKSTVTFELARSIAETGKTVLLIDTDMRKSVMVGRHRARAEKGGVIYGLSHYLSGQKKLDQVLYATSIQNVYMVFAGRSVPNPIELLEKRYFEDMIAFAKDAFDYVLVDCAPLGAAIDAALIAKRCDASVLVVAQGMVSARTIAGAKHQLEASGTPILGIVLNKVKAATGRYGHYYGYGKYYGGYYGNYYGNEDDRHDSKKGRK